MSARIQFSKPQKRLTTNNDFCHNYVKIATIIYTMSNKKAPQKKKNTYKDRLDSPHT